MPELPEVTVVINELKKTSIINQRIKSVNVFLPKVIKNTTVDKFKKFFVNEFIKNITRKGKYLIFELTHNKWWVVHLRMEGKLFYQTPNEQRINRFLMAQLIFSNGRELNYYDTRMFGTFHIYLGEEINKSKELNKLAIDPLDKNFTGQYLFNRISNINRAIKTVLLDQTVVSGIGNIYADEILFYGKINPLRVAKNISLNQCKLIAKGSKLIFNEAIKYNGTTIDSFMVNASHVGNYQDKLKVHNRNNHPCPICGTLIKMIKINGRGTYYCPHCQK